MNDESNRPALEQLHHAWQQLQPPAPDPELDASDALTRASVEWTRQAWQQLQAPELAPPAAAPRAVAPGWRTWHRPAAAALLMLGLALALHNRPTSTPRVPMPNAPPRVAVLGDKLELRSGPVRLLLITSPTPAGNPAPR